MQNHREFQYCILNSETYGPDEYMYMKCRYTVVMPLVLFEYVGKCRSRPERGTPWYQIIPHSALSSFGCGSESESEIYWNEPVYPGHYYSFNTHTMRAFALPGMPGLAYAS